MSATDFSSAYLSLLSFFLSPFARLLSWHSASAVACPRISSSFLHLHHRCVLLYASASLAILGWNSSMLMVSSFYSYTSFRFLYVNDRRWFLAFSCRYSLHQRCSARSVQMSVWHCIEPLLVGMIIFTAILDLVLVGCWRELRQAALPGADNLPDPSITDRMSAGIAVRPELKSDQPFRHHKTQIVMIENNQSINAPGKQEVPVNNRVTEFLGLSMQQRSLLLDPSMCLRLLQTADAVSKPLLLQESEYRITRPFSNPPY